MLIEVYFIENRLLAVVYWIYITPFLWPLSLQSFRRVFHPFHSHLALWCRILIQFCWSSSSLLFSLSPLSLLHTLFTFSSLPFPYSSICCVYQPQKCLRTCRDKSTAKYVLFMEIDVAPIITDSKMSLFFSSTTKLNQKSQSRWKRNRITNLSRISHESTTKSNFLMVKWYYR